MNFKLEFFQKTICFNFTELQTTYGTAGQP